MVGLYYCPPGNPLSRLGVFAGPVAVPETGRSPASDLGTVSSARTLSTGSRRGLIVFRWARAARRPASCRGGSALIAARGAACRARCPPGGRGSHLPGRAPGGWADVPQSGLSDTVNRIIPPCWRPRGRSCAAVVRSSPLLSKIVGRAGDTRRMRGLRSRRFHIVEHVSISRAGCPRSGTGVHPAGTLPGMREHRAAGGVTPPGQSPTASRSPQRPGARQPLPRPPTSRTRRQSRRNPPHLSTICDTRGGRPVHARRPGRRRPCPPETGGR